MWKDGFKKAKNSSQNFEQILAIGTASKTNPLFVTVFWHVKYAV